MKRFLFALGLGITMAGVMVGALINPVAAQNPDNFTISRFEADYYLDKDSEGRSTLKTVERITAIFPVFDQNHGLERALPKDYDGHPTSLRIESVTGGTGQKLPYSDRESNGNLVLRIGDSDKYVHGEQTYVITYSQRDVTRFFSDTNADEFYWDVNGVEWAQTIGRISARVHVSTAASQALSSRTSCYVGVEGSTATCPIARQSLENETIFSVGTENLNPYENVTFAIGFIPNTFVGYQLTWQERIWAILFIIWIVLLVVGSIVAIVVLVWMSVAYYRLMRRVKGRGTVVPEYLPPQNTSVLTSALILRNSTSDVTAQLIDLAVRHYLKIYQTREKSLLKAAEYELEIVKDIGNLQKEEQQLLKDLFGNSAVTPGSRLKMDVLRKEHAIGVKLMAGRSAVRESARTEYGLYERAAVEAKRFVKAGFILLAIGILTLSPLIIIVAIVAFILASLAWPLTDKGVELRDYLRGLRMYITVAEEDRIKLLQSPEGAEKIGRHISNNDSARLVKLYERVLPYAVLFGIEKKWAKQLGTYYEAAGEQPDWYVGNGVFNAVMFTSALNGFSSQSSSYSSSTSSSSGGSSGGGSSGGGGGGGGGGGW